MVNVILPLLLLAVGIFLLFRLRFFFILHPCRTIGEIFRGLRDPRSRRALALALAGTLGVGNIFGVGAGIMLGGEGVVFWIFLSSLISMVIKYAETLLASEMPSEGGMAEVISRLLGQGAGRVYALLTLLLALFMGGAMQSVAFYDTAESSLGLAPWVARIVLLILLTVCLLFGLRKVERITEFLIPLTTIGYIMMCFGVIFVNFSQLSDAISRIISSAFSPRAAVIGIIPVALCRGFSAGVLSNEAGIGSSATAHVRGGERTAHQAGLFGIVEVFFDTTLLCTLSGLAIVMAVGDFSAYDSPMALVSAAFTTSLGGWAGGVICLFILSFAYATIICWLFYGETYRRLYFGRVPFKLLFALALILPMESGLLLSTVDTVIFFMAVIVLSAIIKGRDRIA